MGKAIEQSSAAKTDEERGRNEVKAAAKTKDAVHALAESFDTLHSDLSRVPGVVKQIVKHVTIEDAMVVSLPNALSKEASTRQGFDHMVMEQLKLKVAARIAELDSTVSNSA